MRDGRSYIALKHMANSSACGTPLEDWISIEESDGTIIPKHCPHCARLKQKKCLTCDRTFQPGCKLRHTCVECYLNNCKKLDLDSIHTLKY